MTSAQCLALAPRSLEDGIALSLRSFWTLGHGRQCVHRPEFCLALCCLWTVVG